LTFHKLKRGGINMGVKNWVDLKIKKYNLIDIKLIQLSSAALVLMIAKAIVTFTLSGSTARMVSRYRPPVPIIAASTRDSTVRKLALSWGVYPFKSEELENTDDMIEKSRKVALATGLVEKGDKIIITAGIPFKIPGTTNLLHKS
ncbi:unnamed protein product, partial [marine sediment metagenome]